MSNPSNVFDTPTTTNHSTTILGMPFDVYSLGYGLLVGAGGVLGYAKAKSIPSLVAGLTFCSLIAGGSYLEATRDNHYLTFGSSFVLLGMMGQRFLKSKKFMPSGLVSALSLAMVVRYSIRTYQVSREGSGKA